MNQPQITTILFDLGEVILTNDWTFVCPEKDQEFNDYYHAPNFIYKKARLFENFHTGKISELEFWRISLAEADAIRTDPEKAIAIARKYQKEKEPGMFELLVKLGKNGYHLGVISTSSKEMIDWKKKKFHLANYFEHIIDSGYAGVNKPDPRIYQLALGKFGIKPQEAIFIDDSEKNTKAAEKLGMIGITFTNRKNLIKDLQKKGVKI